MNNIQIDVFIILLLKLLYVARIRGKDDRMEADIKEIMTMLNKIKTDGDFFTREVYMDDEEIGSISKYYDPDVTQANDYKLFHVLNIALSCEYSEIAYHYIKLSDMIMDECLSKIYSLQQRQDCLQNYYSTYVKNFMEHTKIMVLSLAYLMKLTKNPVFKYHEVLKYLLLWYTFTYHNYYRNRNGKIFFNLYPNHMSLIEPIKLTNYQIKSSLERFIFKRCKYQEFKSFLDQVESTIKLGDLIETMGNKLISLGIPNYHSVQTKSVINSSDAELRTLIKILKSQVPQGSIKIPMKIRKITDEEKRTDMQEVFDKSIKDSLELDEIIIYNQTLIQVVYDVIILHEIKGVQKIIMDSTVSNKNGECINLLVKVENCIINFRDNALYEQSIILRQRLLENLVSLADVCLLMKDPKNHDRIKNIVADWKKKVKWVHEIKSNAEFGSFLESLSKTLIAAKFHPVVLNAFWENPDVDYDAKHIRLYGWHSKLYTMYYKPVDRVLCNKISVPINLLIYIKMEINNCIPGVDYNEKCFLRFHNNLNDAIVRIANITLNVPSQYSLDWKKILLTLLHNKNNSRLFGEQAQKSLKKVDINRLIRFLYAVINRLSEKRFVLCSCGASCVPNDVGKCSDPVEEHWTENVKNIDDVEVVKALQDLMLYRKKFQIITDRIEKLNTNWSGPSEIMIYWDGNKKHLRDVYNSYKEQAFDIQDAENYANFFVKWVTAIPYTRLILLVQGMAGKNLKDVAVTMTSEKVAEIKTSVDSFLNLGVLANSSVDYYFTHMVLTLKSFTVGNSNYVQIILTVPYDEIGTLNVVDIPAFTGDYSEWISKFLSEINQLVTLLTLSKDGNNGLFINKNFLSVFVISCIHYYSAYIVHENRLVS